MKTTIVPMAVGFTMVSLFLSGCTSPAVVENSGPILSSSATSESLEAPKDGKILVLIHGNARGRGSVWVEEDASLATIEDLFAPAPQLASRTVTIWRRESGRVKRLRCRMDKMSRSEKEKLNVLHGDWISFVFDGCFGFEPINSAHGRAG